jgi:hypothetical protein
MCVGFALVQECRERYRIDQGGYFTPLPSPWCVWYVVTCSWACHIDNELGVVLSLLPDLQFSTALSGIAFWFMLFSSHDLVSVYLHDVSSQLLFQHMVVVLLQLRDVAINACECFWKHDAGLWGGQSSLGSWWSWGDSILEVSEDFVKVGGQSIEGFWRSLKSTRGVFFGQSWHNRKIKQ